MYLHFDILQHLLPVYWPAKRSSALEMCLLMPGRIAEGGELSIFQAAGTGGRHCPPE